MKDKEYLEKVVLDYAKTIDRMQNEFLKDLNNKAIQKDYEKILLNLKIIHHSVQHLHNLTKLLA